MRGRSKLLLLISMIAVFSVFATGCFFLDFIFGPEPDKETTEEEAEHISEDDTDDPQERVSDDEDMRDTVFYLTDTHDNVVPIVRAIEWEEGIATKTLNKMSQSQENLQFWEDTALNPPLPNGTRVIGMTVRDGVATVNFSQEIMQVDDTKGEQIIDSIVYTLTEFNTVDEVEIMVGGEYLDTFPGGIDTDGTISRTGVNTEVTSPAKGVDTRSAITLYFVSQDDEYLVPVTRYIPEEDELEGNAIYHLIEGPDQESGLTSYVSPNLSVNNVDMVGTTLQLDVSNLSEDPEHEEQALKQLVYTLKEFDHVNDVDLMIDGSPAPVDEVDGSYVNQFIW